MLQPCTTFLFLSVSNSTAYWLHYIIYNHNCVRYHATAARSATGRSAYMKTELFGYTVLE